MQFSGASHRPDFSTRRTPVPTSATAVPRTAPGSHPVGPGTWAGRVAPAAPRCLALPSLAPAVQRGGGRFTGCQSRGQRSAGVRKSISERSLSTSFNLMKPLFVKAAALPASPVKRSQAQRPALKEQEGVPFPFTFTAPPPKKKKQKHKYGTHRNMTGLGRRCCVAGAGGSEVGSPPVGLAFGKSPRTGRNLGSLRSGAEPEH